MSEFRQEAGILASLRHPNIVLLLGTSGPQEKDYLIVTEFMNKVLPPLHMLTLLAFIILLLFMLSFSLLVHLLLELIAFVIFFCHSLQNSSCSWLS